MRDCIDLEFFRVTLVAHDFSFALKLKTSECLQVQGDSNFVAYNSNAVSFV